MCSIDLPYTDSYHFLISETISFTKKTHGRVTLAIGGDNRFVMLRADQELLKQQLNAETLRGKRFFITGATGFFGKNLIESLLYLNQEFNLGIQITALVRDRVKANLDSTIEIIETDILGLPHVSVPNAFDSVIHLATTTNLTQLNENPEIERKNIIDGTQYVLDFCKRTNSKHYVYLSSGAIYGKQPSSIQKLKEEDFPQFQALNNDVYGHSKVIAEQRCISFSKLNTIPGVIFRGFAFAGPHLSLDRHYAITSFLGQALKGNPIVVNDAATERSYLYIVDAVIWILKAAIMKADGIYNMGSDVPVNMEALANQISQQVKNSKVQILNCSSASNRYVPNIERAKRELGVGVYTPIERSIFLMSESNKACFK